jgi:hypothetical protein
VVLGVAPADLPEGRLSSLIRLDLRYDVSFCGSDRQPRTISRQARSHLTVGAGRFKRAGMPMLPGKQILS